MASLMVRAGSAIARVTARANSSMNRHLSDEHQARHDGLATAAHADTRNIKLSLNKAKEKIKLKLNDVTGKKKRRELAAQIVIHESKNAALESRAAELVEENEVLQDEHRELEAQHRVTVEEAQQTALDLDVASKELGKLQQHLSTVIEVLEQACVAVERKITSLNSVVADLRSENDIVLEEKTAAVTAVTVLQHNQDILESQLKGALDDREKIQRACDAELAMLNTDQEKPRTSHAEEIQVARLEASALLDQSNLLQQKVDGLEKELADRTETEEATVARIQARVEVLEQRSEDKQEQIEQGAAEYYEDMQMKNEEIEQLRSMLKEKDKQLGILKSGTQKIAAPRNRRPPPSKPIRKDVAAEQASELGLVNTKAGSAAEKTATKDEELATLRAELESTKYQLQEETRQRIQLLLAQLDNYPTSNSIHQDTEVLKPVELSLRKIQQVLLPKDQNTEDLGKYHSTKKWILACSDRAMLSQEVTKVQQRLGLSPLSISPTPVKECRSGDQIRNFRQEMSPLKTVTFAEEVTDEADVPPKPKALAADVGADQSEFPGLADTSEAQGGDAEDDDDDLYEIDQASGDGESEESSSDSDDEVEFTLDGPSTESGDSSMPVVYEEDDEDLLRLEESFY